MFNMYFLWKLEFHYCITEELCGDLFKALNKIIKLLKIIAGNYLLKHLL